MGRLIDALLWHDVRAGRPAPAIPAGVTAGAGRVALASTAGAGAGRLPFAVGGDNLVPINPADVPYMTGLWGRDSAMSLPTIRRARDLICTAVGSLPLTMYTSDFSIAEPIERAVPARSWCRRPNPNVPRQHIVAWTCDDLYFYGLAHWRVTARYADTFPSAFERILPGDFGWDERTGKATVNGDEVAPADIIEFLSPVDGVLAVGYRAVSIALQLDDAADRFAGTEVPAGWLQETDGGEDLSGDDLTALARTFNDARRANTTAAVSKYLDYREASYDASKMQLVEGRTYQALELARLGNVPPYLVGAPGGTGMTYLSAQQAKADLIDFGALPFIGCIEQTLSGPNVLPRGTFVRLDLNAFLRNPFTTTGPGGTAEESPNDMQVAVNPPPAQP